MTITNPSAAYFDQVAGQWDALRSGYFREAVRDAAIAKAYLHPKMLVADVGSGTGFMAAGLAPLVEKVHLLDGSASMLDVARQNLAQFANLEFHAADGLALPLPDASLDAVFANMYLHHCPDPLAAIREMMRILRPGGRLVITDMDAHRHEWMKAEMADVWLGFERHQLRTWYEEAGLVNVIVDCTGESCQSECQSQDGEHVDISIFVAAGTKRIAARDAVQASYAARALGGSSCCSEASCCAPGDALPGVISLDEIASVDWNGGYTPADKTGVPSEAAEFSLGCGNPLAMAGLREGETVLDIGSGGGLDAFIAARRVGPTGQVIGVDMTPAMLQRARRAAKKGGFDHVKFKHGFAEKLPVPDASVDVIISNCVINLTEDKGKVFREAFRALRKNGRLEVNDVVFGGAILPAARLSQAGWSECVSGALPEQEYVDLVRQAGFQKVSVRRSTSSGTSDGVPIYSVQVSAVKE
ncbi:MAG TPA: methyltransferase domain-containing protein [Anaerolineales bacterium]|nr:methyltransferase domain-containing protein [Anaerolineales bacterium]